MRDYDPGIDRYIQSDPLGISGGLNTYVYGASNTLRNIDPLGLLLWRGSYHSRGWAAPWGWFYVDVDLVSPCINKQRARIHVVATGPAVGYGIAISEHYSGRADFEDYKDYIAPTSFFGFFGAVSGAATVGKRTYFYLGKMRLGNAWQVDNFELNEGGGGGLDLDVGLTLTSGVSAVTDVDIECCPE